VDKVIASVNGFPITSYELNQTMTNLHLNSKQALQYLINQKILKSEIEKRGISVDEFDINNAMQQIAQRNGMTLFEFKNILQQKGELKKFEKMIKENLLKQKLFNQIVDSQLRITPQEVKNYYQNHKSEYTIFDTIQVTEYTANNPEELKKLQQDPLLNQVGVNQKTLLLESKNLPLKLLFLFKNTKVGEFTPVINEGMQYVTYYVQNKTGKTVLPFDKVKDYVTQELIEKKRNEILNDYFNKLRNEADIKIYN
jgi:parvulin-like peptidyl-prolyl isomerase